jgi:hypothetical protein
VSALSPVRVFGRILHRLISKHVDLVQSNEIRQGRAGETRHGPIREGRIPTPNVDSQRMAGRSKGGSRMPGLLPTVLRSIARWELIRFYLVRGSQANYHANQGDAWEEFWACKRAGLMDRAHRIVLSLLAPEVVLREDVTLLRKLLGELQHARVTDWHKGGQVSRKAGR